MFSFHKPKVYRSTQGCCICKAKSSSSRFTDSLKYENDFIECFQLSTPRKGEICNACVLLVKRYKRLPPGSNRHWGHVVDARVGPGLKSMSKFKKRKEEQLLLQQNGGKINTNPNSLQNPKTVSIVSERFGKIFKKNKKKTILISSKREGSPVGSSDENSSPSSPTSMHSDIEDSKICEIPYKICQETDYKTKIIKKSQRKGNHPYKNRRLIEASFVDDDFWHQIKTCCGIAYENKLFDAVLLLNSEINETCSYHRKLLDNPDNEVEALTLNSQSKDMPVVTNISRICGQNVKPSDLVNHIPFADETTVITTSLKKHSILSKWQNENASKVDTILGNKTDDLVYNISIKRTDIEKNQIERNKVDQIQDAIPLLSIKHNYKLSKLASSGEIKPASYLHKMKTDSSRIVKNSFNKIAPSKLKGTDIVKNLVKLCAEKSAKVNPLNDEKISIGIGNEKIIEVLGSKFNENSSDSGYEEISQESNQKGRLSTIRPVILSNGIKLHVQPQNLVLAANLAGVSQIHHKQISSKIPHQSTNHIIKIHSRDIIQNGIISSTTNNSLDTISLTGQQQQQQPHNQINKKETTVGGQPSSNNLNQNLLTLNGAYFQQATN